MEEAGTPYRDGPGPADEPGRVFRGLALWRLMLDGPLMKLAAALAAVGLVILIGGLRFGDLPSLWRFSGALAEAPGTLDAEARTWLSEGHDGVTAIHYHFEAPRGHVHHGVSHTIGRLLPGTALVVEYRRDDPSVSRIRGMWSGVVPPWVALIGAAAFALGALLVRMAWRRGRRTRAILERGVRVDGKVVAKPQVGLRDDEPLFGVTLEYQAEGQRNQVTFKTLHPPGGDEAVLVHPADPRQALVVRELPGWLSLAGEREVREDGKDRWAWTGTYLLAALALLGAVVFSIVV